MASKKTKDALIDFYANMEAWYDGLSPVGRVACDLWIDTGNIAALLPYLPRPVAKYFIDSIRVVPVSSVQQLVGIVGERSGVLNLAV